MLRTGKVSSVHAETGSVRVSFADMDQAVSGELPVLCAAGWAKGNALPAVDETVLCVFPRGNLREGFCLGSFWRKGNPPPGDPDSQRGVWFPDGSHVYYDRGTNTLQIKAAGGVRIMGDLVVTGTISQSGGGT